MLQCFKTKRTYDLYQLFYSHDVTIAKIKLLPVNMNKKKSITLHQNPMDKVGQQSRQVVGI